MRRDGPHLCSVVVDLIVLIEDVHSVRLSVVNVDVKNGVVKVGCAGSDEMFENRYALHPPRERVDSIGAGFAPFLALAEETLVYTDHNELRE